VSQLGALPDGDTFVTNFHISSVSTLSSVHTAASTAVETFWTGTFAQYPTPGVVLQHIVTTQLDGGTGKNTSALVKDVNHPGTGTAPTTPQASCVVVSLRTANASKAGRGRQYLPCLATSALTPTGTWSSTIANAIDTAYTNMVTSLASTGAVVILHGGFNGRVNGAPTYLPLSGDNVTSVAVNTLPGQQRRRKNQALASFTPFLAVG
jgi:hypothetical protein